MSECGCPPAPQQYPPQTSGETDWAPPATDVVARALRDLGVINDDENPTAGMYFTCFAKLNNIMKELEASGIHVWTEEEALLFLQPYQARYLLGTDAKGNPSVDHCCDAYKWALGALTSSAPAGSASVALMAPPVPSNVPISGILAGDNFGVVLDSGVTFWTTVAAINGNVISFPAGVTLPGSASAQNYVFDYTTNIVRPLKVPGARTLYYQGLLETPWSYMYSRQEYMDLPNKQAPGVPTQGSYFPTIPQGQMFIYPVPKFSYWGARFTWYRPLQIFTTPDNIPDLPEEWGNTLEWLLALEAGPSYSVPPQRWQVVQTMAAQKKEMLEDWDRESEDVQFAVGYDQTMR